MFPISLEGEIETRQLSPTAVEPMLRQLELALVRERASRIHRAGTKVTFRAGGFRPVFNWNVLVPASYGEIEIAAGQPGAVRYRFSLMEILMMTTLIAIFMGCFAFFVTGRPIVVLAVAVLAWLWLFGLNYLIASRRLPKFVREATCLPG